MLYLLVTLAGVIIELLSRRSQQWHAYAMLLVDLLTFTALMHLNGGPNLQLSMLYLVTVVTAHLLLPTRSATAVSVTTALAVIYQQFYYSIIYQLDSRNLSAAGLLAASFLMTSLLAHGANRRLKQVEAESLQHAQTALQLHQMNQRVIDQMRQGVVVFDQRYRILFSNQAANRLLPQFFGPNGSAILIQRELLPLLQQARQGDQQELIWQPSVGQKLGLTLNWLEQPTDSPGHELASSTPLGMVWLEDIARLNQHVQQLKLASLGRLTASIAHEIRNPLAAITQAVELLRLELEDAAREQRPMDRAMEQELLDMVTGQAQRMNGIITDILQLSRRDEHRIAAIDLCNWLTRFIQEFPHTAEGKIEVTCTPGLIVHFDPDRLYQVVANLVANALRHGQPAAPAPHVVQLAASRQRARRPYGNRPEDVVLQVLDRGPGIEPAHQKVLFEPFFTTSSQGTGLGLYLSRALCEAGGAELLYYPLMIGSCFEVRFDVLPLADATPRVASAHDGMLF